MAVRNFWIEADIDGRTTTLTGGPRSKDGGFSLDIFIRDEGASTKAITIMGHVIGGRLTLSAVDCINIRNAQALRITTHR